MKTLQAQETYKYFYAPGQQGSDVKIERTCMGNAYATSGTVGDMGPFTMCFNAETGEGMGEYVGTYLEEYAEGEVKTTNYNVTFEHNKPAFRDHTVFIKVRENEDMLKEAVKAAEADGMIFASDGYNNQPISWEQLQADKKAKAEELKQKKKQVRGLFTWQD